MNIRKSLIKELHTLKEEDINTTDAIVYLPSKRRRKSLWCGNEDVNFYIGNRENIYLHFDGLDIDAEDAKEISYAEFTRRLENDYKVGALLYVEIELRSCYHEDDEAGDFELCRLKLKDGVIYYGLAVGKK